MIVSLSQSCRTIKKNSGVILAVITLTVAMPIAADAELTRLTPGFSEPLTFSGTSGGPNDSGNCGTVAATPNHEMQLTEDFAYLQFQVKAATTTTLLVQGPAGHFCVLPESAGDDFLVLSGYMPKGAYALYIGDRAQSHNPYTLSISQQHNES